MDRKQEFAEHVRVIDRAHGERDGRALVGAVTKLSNKVDALRARLSGGDRSAIDEALDLLEIVQPVFGVGYVQQKLVRGLKRADLDRSQLGRLEFVALKLVTSSLQGGQLREVIRVLRGRPTDTLLVKLQELATSGDVSTRRRASRALSVLTQQGPPR